MAIGLFISSFLAPPSSGWEAPLYERSSAEQSNTITARRVHDESYSLGKIPNKDTSQRLG